MANLRLSIRKYRQLIFYAISLGVLLVLLQWLEIRFLVMTNTFEIYGGAIAIIFTALGIWLATKLTKPKITIVEKEVIKGDLEFRFNQEAFERLGLSRRELEVLELMAKGLSNQEIGEQLFVSLNTVKTHVARLFEKMEVKRRTQAVEQAKNLRLIR